MAKGTALFDAFDRLSGREKLMVGGLLGAVFITAVVIVWMIVGAQISELEARNQQVKESLEQVMLHKDSYLLNKAKLDAHKKKLDTNKIKLVQLMEREGNKLGITIEDFREGKRWLTEKHRRMKKRDGAKKRKVIDLLEESQTVTIRRIGLENLSKFIAALESRPQPIKITKLSISTLSSDRQVLRQVKMTVSTYRNKEVEF